MRSSEYVAIGHPDKIADFISENILDVYLKRDSNVRYALEVQIKNNRICLGGEITSVSFLNEDEIHSICQTAIEKIGYTPEYQKRFGSENTISCHDLIVLPLIQKQSPEIAIGVENDGWGDQGIFTGYAENNPTYNYMPLDHALARDLNKYLYEFVLQNQIGGLDIKTQITLSNNLIYIVAAVPTVNSEEHEIIKTQIENWFLEKNISTPYQIILNGTGIYKMHSSIGDCGTTGRKLAVDFYGGNAPIGGGCPWTKDGTKADLALNLYSRMMAKQSLIEYNQNHSTSAHHAIYQTCCCIGRKDLQGILKLYDSEKHLIGQKIFFEEIGQKELVRRFGLNQPIFSNLCLNGLFYNSQYPWETNKQEVK